MRLPAAPLNPRFSSDAEGLQSWNQSYRLRALTSLFEKTGEDVFARLALKSMRLTLAANDALQRRTGPDRPQCGWSSTIYGTNPGERLSLMINQAMIAGDWSTALITPLMGNEAPDSVRFQSLCFESLIKVPLWITDTDRECSRIQAITGSFDIAATLADLFGQRATNEVGSAVSRVIDGDGGSRHDDDSPTEGDTRRLHGPASLLTAVTTPGQPSERSLLIESSTARAIRSRSFLFVTEREPSGSSRPRLYAKPDDGWNVNDVSSEYLQQTRDFEELLENAIR